MKKDKRMIIKPLKVREGIGRDVELIWDIENGVFKEIPAAQSSYSAGITKPFDSGIGGGLFGASDSGEEVPF
jgi:hypothetical protein